MQRILARDRLATLDHLEHAGGSRPGPSGAIGDDQVSTLTPGHQIDDLSKLRVEQHLKRGSTTLVDAGGLLGQSCTGQRGGQVS